MHPNQPLRLRIYGRIPPLAAGQTPAPADHGQPLRISLERALAKLEQLPRMFVEPDGSFLWTGDDSGSSGHWQLEGTVYDDGQVVRYVDLHGHCPAGQWKQFLAAFDESLDSVLLQRLDCNVIVDGRWLLDGSEG